MRRMSIEMNLVVRNFTITDVWFVNVGNLRDMIIQNYQDLQSWM